MHYQLKVASTNPLANLNDRNPPPSGSQQLAQHSSRPISTGPMYEELDQHQHQRHAPASHPPGQHMGDPNVRSGGGEVGLRSVKGSKYDQDLVKGDRRGWIIYGA